MLQFRVAKQVAHQMLEDLVRAHHNKPVIALFTVMSTLGASTDVTLSELAVEFFSPVDESSERLVRSTYAALATDQ